MRRSCETCFFNVQTEDNGRHEDVCHHPDHPGIQSNSVFSDGCSDWIAGRISRKGDQSVYQPKIHHERVRQLYLLKEITGIPMTVLLDRAIEVYVTNHASSFADTQESVEPNESDILDSDNLHNQL